MADETVLNINLVLVGVDLLNEPGMVDQFRSDFGPDMSAEVDPVAAAVRGLAEPPRTLTLGKDRIQLMLHATKSAISQEYPEDMAFTKLASVAFRAIELSKSKSPKAIGYNMGWIFEQDSGQPAIQYIGNRLFGTLPLDEPGRRIVGGNGKLIFEDAAGQWIITVEPRFNDPNTSLVFVGLNLHKQQPHFPSESEIKTTLTKVLQEARAFAKRLEAGSP